MGLLDAFKQYIRDASPGGLLNSEWTPENVRTAGEVTSMIPNPVGDIASGLLAVDDVRKGDYGSAALNGLGLLPFVPAMGGVVRNIYHGTSPEAAEAIAKRGFDVKQSADGTVWFTENPLIGEVGAARKGAVVKRQIDDEKLKLGGWPEYDRYSTGELMSMGYDGLKLTDSGEYPVYRIYKPNKTTKKVKD